MDKRGFTILLGVLVAVLGFSGIAYSILGNRNSVNNLSESSSSISQTSTGELSGISQSDISTMDVVSSSSSSDSSSMSVLESSVSQVEQSTSSSAVSISSSSVSATASSSSVSESKVYNIVQDFELYDRNGNAVKLHSKLGKPVIINVWATWCGPCRTEMPDIQKLYEKYSNDIEFVMLNATTTRNESVEKVEQYIQQNGYTFPVYYDTNGAGQNALNIWAFPTTYVLSSKGEILFNAARMMDIDTFTSLVEMALAHEGK